MITEIERKIEEAIVKESKKQEEANCFENILTLVSDDKISVVVSGEEIFYLFYH